MLQINMADVMNVIGSLTPYLIAIGVLFVLALIITFAVNKKTVKEVATRKICLLYTSPSPRDTR